MLDPADSYLTLKRMSCITKLITFENSAVPWRINFENVKSMLSTARESSILNRDLTWESVTRSEQV